MQVTISTTATQTMNKDQQQHQATDTTTQTTTTAQEAKGTTNTATTGLNTANRNIYTIFRNFNAKECDDESKKSDLEFACEVRNNSVQGGLNTCDHLYNTFAQRVANAGANINDYDVKFFYKVKSIDDDDDELVWVRFFCDNNKNRNMYLLKERQSLRFVLKKKVARSTGTLSSSASMPKLRYWL